jgi:hypothetical protein
LETKNILSAHARKLISYDRSNNPGFNPGGNQELHHEALAKRQVTASLKT